MSLQDAEKSLLIAKNQHDMVLEKHRDIELYQLRQNRNKMSEQDYRCKYDTIYNDFEAKMFRVWTDKELLKRLDLK